MSPLLQSLFSRYRSMSWGQRGYALTVLLAAIVFSAAALNGWRARTYEGMHRRIAAAGAKSTCSVTVIDDAEEAYFLALLEEGKKGERGQASLSVHPRFQPGANAPAPP